MSGTIQPPKTIVQTLSINNYRYGLSNLIPHHSVTYNIECYSDNTFIKSIQGILDGEKYKEWTTDDWLDAYIKSIIEELPVTEVIEPAPEPTPEPVV